MASHITRLQMAKHQPPIHRMMPHLTQSNTSGSTHNISSHLVCDNYTWWHQRWRHCMGRYENLEQSCKCTQCSLSSRNVITTRCIRVTFVTRNCSNAVYNDQRWQCFALLGSLYELPC